MTKALQISSSDLFENPTPRVPIVLCLDCSSSMDGEPINELRQGVEHFFRDVYDDEIARYSAEIAVVTFGIDVRCVAEFGPVNERPHFPLIAAGRTPIGQAVEMALRKLQDRKQHYKNAGVDYYQPWLVLMTDGHPTDNTDDAVGRTRFAVKSNQLSIFPIGIGPHANMETLQQFSPTRPPLRLKGLAFHEFFEWLSQSIQQVSASTPGETVKLDVEGIKAWGEVPT